MSTWDPQAGTYVDWLLANPSAWQVPGTHPYQPPPADTPTPPPASPPPPPVAAAPPPPAGTSTGVGGLTPDQLNTQSIIQATLRQYGLDTPELTQWAHDAVVNGTTADQLNLELYDPSSTPGKVVDRLYPAIAKRRTGGLPPISIGDYVNTADTMRQLVSRAGLTDYTDVPTLVDDWIAGDVSPSEAQDRIQTAQAAVFTEPPEVRAEFEREFNVPHPLGAATAYFLDPANTVPKIKQQLTAAQIGGAAVRTGYGLLTADETTRLAQLGVTGDQAQQGLSQLGQQRQLFAPLPGETGGTGVSTDEQLAAQFGADVNAQQRIEQQRRARLAVFGGGGGFGPNQRGVGGLGVSEGG